MRLIFVTLKSSSGITYLTASVSNPGTESLDDVILGDETSVPVTEKRGISPSKFIDVT
jgi:hypothetical protein